MVHFEAPRRPPVDVFTVAPARIARASVQPQIAVDGALDARSSEAISVSPNIPAASIIPRVSAVRSRAAVSGSGMSWARSTSATVATISRFSASVWIEDGFRSFELVA
ncbi:hypothetical protein D7006_16725 [Xanthobacter sp. YC-JY1]|nr:hypothetical protein D7006_16725 [Xanthobacter sp. YC-JY1]